MVMRERIQNKGVALIMALMVFALIAAVSATIMSQLARERSLISQLQETAILKQQLLGGEAWARATFTGMENSTLPSASEAPLILKKQSFNLDNEDDSMSVIMIDRQNCYNLNRLADEELSEQALQEVERLLTEIGLDKTLAEQLKDWVDADQNITGNTGHEDEFYQGLTPSFRTADSHFIAETELKLLQFTDKTITTLLSHFCFWPQDIGININRVSTQIIKSMLPGLDAAKESALLAQITTGGFSSLSDFINHDSVSGITLNEEDWRLDLALVDVFVDVTLGGRSMFLHSKLYKQDSGSVVSYYRAYGPNQQLQKWFGLTLKTTSK
ncbi:general secretion pathway protein GspK [Marinomonas agarivorans]|nr:general secretion pathway protein GspK [Marinomonas agarivorans]